MQTVLLKFSLLKATQRDPVILFHITVSWGKKKRKEGKEWQKQYKNDSALSRHQWLVLWARRSQQGQQKELELQDKMKQRRRHSSVFCPSLLTLAQPPVDTLSHSNPLTTLRLHCPII